ncbi:antitoxin HicB [Gammaproteobacteria bacterium]
MLAYPVELEPDDNGTILVTFPDIPEAVTFGEDEEDALGHALDCLDTVLWARIKDREDIPLPSPLDGRRGVFLPPLLEAKISLYRAMREQGVPKAELARRLGWHMPQVEKLLDFNCTLRVDQIEAAARVLGKHLEIRMM